MNRLVILLLIPVLSGLTSCRTLHEPETDLSDELPWETDPADSDDGAETEGSSTDPGMPPISPDTAQADTESHAFPDTGTDTAIPTQPDTDWNTDWDPAFGVETLARDVRITAIDMYQNTRIPIMRDGTAVSNPWISLVENKEALLRVSVTPAPHRPVGRIMARVAIRNGEDLPVVYPIEQDISDPSDDSALDSTLNLRIPRAHIARTLRIRVSLHEPDIVNPTNGSTTDTIWPLTGMDALPVETTNGNLRLVVVPIRYDADNSFRLPDTSETELTRIVNQTLGMMPFPDVELHVAEVFPWSEPLRRFGNGWSELLTAFILHRGEMGGYRDYYLGLINPAETFDAYCQRACVNGMSPVSHRDYVAGRAFLALGYGGDDNMFTILHEMGHAMGRDHTETAGNPADPDPDYPYADGLIGNPGWHAGLQQRYAPDQYYDIMGYQWPQWISDYTAGALKERLTYVNSHVWSRSVHTTSFSSAILYSDGQAVRAGTFVSTGATAGRPLQVIWLDAYNEPIGTQQGYYTPYSGGFSGLVVFETPPDPVVAVQLEGASHPLRLQ